MTRVTHPPIGCTVAEFARWLSNYARFTRFESCDARGYIVKHDPPLVDYGLQRFVRCPADVASFGADGIVFDPQLITAAVEQSPGWGCSVIILPPRSCRIESAGVYWRRCTNRDWPKSPTGAYWDIGREIHKLGGRNDLDEQPSRSDLSVQR